MKSLDLCALRPQGLFENLRDERDSVNQDTSWLTTTESDGQAQEVLLAPMADRLAGFRAFVP